MKKLLASMLAAMLLLSVLPAQAAEVTGRVMVEAVQVQAGDRDVEVDIDLSENRGITCMVLTMTYPKGFVLKDIERGDGLEGCNFTPPGDLTANPVNMLWDNLENDHSNGRLVTLTFDVGAQVKPGAYAIRLSYTEGNVIDENLQDIDLQIEHGKVTVAGDQSEIVSPAIGFADVAQDAYYAQPVQWAVEHNITSGMTETTFGPEIACTRAQAVTFLWRAYGSPAPASADMLFTDVPAGAYYYNAVQWAVEHNITSGMSATAFGPDATCTRAQIVTFLWRAAGKPASASANPFGDVQNSDYFHNAVLWAVENEITSGMSADIFAPVQNCTRGQIVTFLHRQLA